MGRSCQAVSNRAEESVSGLVDTEVLVRGAKVASRADSVSSVSHTGEINPTMLCWTTGPTSMAALSGGAVVESHVTGRSACYIPHFSAINHPGWRLPGVKELDSLYRWDAPAGVHCWGPMIPACLCGQGRCDPSDGVQKVAGFQVSFGSGGEFQSVHQVVGYRSQRVRLTRAPLSPPVAAAGCLLNRSFDQSRAQIDHALGRRLIASHRCRSGIERSQVIWRLASWRVAKMPRSRSSACWAAFSGASAAASSASQAWR